MHLRRTIGIIALVRDGDSRLRRRRRLGFRRDERRSGDRRGFGNRRGIGDCAGLGNRRRISHCPGLGNRRRIRHCAGLGNRRRISHRDRRQPTGRVRRRPVGGGSGTRREGTRPGRAVGARQLGRHPRRHRPGRPGPRPGHDRQGAGVLECTGVRHRQWRGTRHGLRRRRWRHGERLALGEPHGGDPPSPDLSGDRQDRLFGSQLRPGSGSSCERRAIPRSERRRLHRRISRRGYRPCRSCRRGRGCRSALPVLLGGLCRPARPGGSARSRRGLHLGDRRGSVRAR